VTIKNEQGFWSEFDVIGFGLSSLVSRMYYACGKPQRDGTCFFPTVDRTV